MTAGTLSWEGDMQYIALPYGEPDTGPVPGTPELITSQITARSAAPAPTEET